MILEKLVYDKNLLVKQLFWLKISFDECTEIGIKKEYEIDEFGKFETLTSRYSRSIDFLIRKIFRTLDEYEFENQGTLVDVVNNAHKRGLFDDVEELRIMKDIRNTVVHEYIEDNLTEIFEEVLAYTKKLIIISESTLKYIEMSINK